MNMNFTSDVKKEIISRKIAGNAEKKAALTPTKEQHRNTSTFIISEKTIFHKEDFSMIKVKYKDFAEMQAVARQILGLDSGSADEPKAFPAPDAKAAPVAPMPAAAPVQTVQPAVPVASTPTMAAPARLRRRLHQQHRFLRQSPPLSRPIHWTTWQGRV